MDRLKKLKASTLLETLVATVLILVIFIISGLILNNLAKNMFQNNNQAIKTQLHKLNYLSQHKKIQLPYKASYKDWEIQIEKDKIRNTISIEAYHSKRNQSLTETYYEAE